MIEITKLTLTIKQEKAAKHSFFFQIKAETFCFCFGRSKLKHFTE